MDIYVVEVKVRNTHEGIELDEVFTANTSEIGK